MASIVSEPAVIPLVEPWFPPEYADKVRDQVLSGFLGPGRATQEFADALARFAGVAGCVLTVSGTVALSVAAKAVGLEAGDEIIVPAYGVISTINGFASMGLRPRLVDIDRATACLPITRVLDAISPKTKAICYVDFSGRVDANLAELAQECSSRGVVLIEDAACALGHRHNGKAAGTFGAMGIYSFSVPKVLTTGQGGAVISHDRVMLDRAAAWIDHGDLEWRKTNLNRDVGTNLRYTDIQASLGLCQMRDVEARLARRRVSFSVLRDLLEEFIYQVADEEAPLHNIVFAERPDELIAFLRSQRIHAVRQYRTLSQHPAYAHLAAACPNADFWTDHAIYLPFGMSLTPDGSARIAATIRQSRVALLPAVA